MIMKIGKVGLLVFIVLVCNWSSSSAWFGDKHRKERKSILADETTSSWVLNRVGSSIMFRVNGNVYPVGFYNVTMNIGYPPRPYFLDIDSGSDLTWLQCDAPCTRCSETPHQLYQPSNDLVPSKDPLCTSLQQSENYECQHLDDQCDYEINYADHYSTIGVLVRDVFILNFTNGIQLKVRMALGCGYDQIFPAHSYHPLDGLLGLGRGKTSLISQLSGQGLVRNVVGHCLSAQGGGYIFFGDVYDSSRLIWTPMTSKDHSKHYSAGAAELILGGKAMRVAGPVTFDSGSSYTYFNSKTYQALISWLKKELARRPIKEASDDQTLPVCWHGKRPFRRISEVKKYFGPLALSFTRGRKSVAKFEIPPEAYLIISTKGNVCLGILNGSEVGMGDMNLIGDISMLDKVMVFDNDRQLIGWAPANCDWIPKFKDVSI